MKKNVCNIYFTCKQMNTDKKKRELSFPISHLHICFVEPPDGPRFSSPFVQCIDIHAHQEITASCEPNAAKPAPCQIAMWEVCQLVCRWFIFFVVAELNHLVR